PVPVRAGGRARPQLPEPARDRLGTGRAAEHGPVALDPAPARGRRGRRASPLRRPRAQGVTVGGLPDGAPPRARADRYGRFFLAARFAAAAAAAAFAILGPWVRAAPMRRRRCEGGKRRQMSYVVSARPIIPGRRKRAIAPFCRFRMSPVREV